jgi:hypothetical protein
MQLIDTARASVQGSRTRRVNVEGKRHEHLKKSINFCQ